MNNTAPKELGIVVVAALFGFIALALSYVVMGFSGFAAVLIGAIVALITAIVLWLGWRDAAAGPMGPRDLSGKPAADKGTTSASVAAKAVGAAAPAMAAGAMSAPSASSAAPTATAKPAAEKPADAPKASVKSAPAAKSTPAAPAAAPVAPAAPAKAASAPADAPGDVAESQPEILSAARGGVADDLKQIKGVGPGLEKTLNELGFYHFDQVASWGEAEIAWVDSRLKFKGRIQRDNWIDQAKTLGAGGTTEFSNKVKKGGVY